MSTDEKLTAFAFAVTVGLWIFGGAIGVNAVAAALTGLAILLVTGALLLACFAFMCVGVGGACALACRVPPCCVRKLAEAFRAPGDAPRAD